MILMVGDDFKTNQRLNYKYIKTRLGRYAQQRDSRRGSLKT